MTHMNLSMKQKQTHRLEDRLVLTKEQRGMDWAFGISGRKLLYIEWINKKPYYITQGTIFNIQ